MKRYFFTVLLFAIAFCVDADSLFNVDGIRYATHDGSTAYVTSISGDEYSGNIVIPSSVKYNGVTYGVTSIGQSAFRSCTELISVEIKNGVASIEEGAFWGCSSLASVIMPNSITSIGNGTFSGCTNLTSITIPNGVTSIEDDVFHGCTGLLSVKIPDSVKSIGGYAFGGCSGLLSVKIPDSVKSIGEYAFSGCSGLLSINLPNSVISIERFAFIECVGLTSINIPDGITSIEEGVFCSCRTILDIKIPNSVFSIGPDAFNDCRNLESIEIPSSVSSIGDRAFANCFNLKSVVVDKNNITFDSRDNCNAAIKTETNELVFGCKATIIPDNVTSIGCCAFYSCKGLTSIEIPNQITFIGAQAFCYCTSLFSISFTRPIPPEFGYIEWNGEKNYDTFYNVDKNIPIYVPCEGLNAYKEVLEELYDFTNIKCTDSDIPTDIPESAENTLYLSQSISITGNTISVDGIDASDIRIFNTAGKQVSNPVPNAGVYVVTVGGEAVKVVVP